MSVDFTVNAEKRSDEGKGASRRLRRAGKFPAVIYGAGKDSVSLTLDQDEVFHHLENEAFFSHILSLKIGKESEKVVLKDMQRHPGRPIILHMDFQRISAKEKINMHIPLHFTGEEDALGIKAGGLASHLMTGVDISCLAKDLPEFIAIDVAAIELGGSLHLSDLTLPEGVEIPALAHGADHDLPIFSIHTPKVIIEEEDEKPAEESVEPEEGGEAPAKEE
jgi:large subunit ribosomal protein L25